MTPAALARKVRKCEVFNTVFYPVLNPSFSSLLSFLLSGSIGDRRSNFTVVDAGR
jgi:hypothetical protein